jgi:hypothetical protein
MVAVVCTSSMATLPMTGVLGQNSSYGPVSVEPGRVVVVEPGGSVPVVLGIVLVVEPDCVVVVIGGEPATAITGAIGLPLGVPDAIPPVLGVASFGYAVQVSSSGDPARVRVSVVAASSWTAMSLLVAVNGPMVSGVDGTDSGTPADGIGLGKVIEKASDPADIVPGVAPDTSTCSLAVPVSVGADAAAPLASPAGRVTVVW